MIPSKIGGISRPPKLHWLLRPAHSAPFGFRIAAPWNRKSSWTFHMEDLVAPASLVTREMGGKSSKLIWLVVEAPILKNMLVKLETLPKNRDENKQYNSAPT